MSWCGDGIDRCDDLVGSDAERCDQGERVRVGLPAAAEFGCVAVGAEHQHVVGQAGQAVAQLRPGESAFTVGSGPKVLRAKMDWCLSPPLAVTDPGPDATVHVVVGFNRF
jgi:hypothetical protein